MLIQNHGTLFLLICETSDDVTWIQEHVRFEVWQQQDDGSIVIDQRYASDIIEAYNNHLVDEEQERLEALREDLLDLVEDYGLEEVQVMLERIALGEVTADCDQDEVCDG